MIPGLETPPSLDEYDNRDPCIDEPGEPIAGQEDVGGYCIPPWEIAPKQRTSAPLAEGGPTPLWPIETGRKKKVRVSYQDQRDKWHGSWGRHMGASRKGDDGTKRHHAGVDLYADEGDIVRAMEDGIVIGVLPFHHGTWAMYVLHEGGVVVNYGEVETNSWTEFGFPLRIDEPVHVTAGQPLARVGLQSGGSTMLHFETYDPNVTMENIKDGDMRWWWGEAAPEGLLDPSKYLVKAQRNWFLEKGLVS